MRRIGLSTKLIFTVGILATIIVAIATLVIGVLVYVQTEQQIKNQLAKASQQIISEHLMVVNDTVAMQKKDDGASLVILLRNMDMSLYIADASGLSLAKYGIYRNISPTELSQLFSLENTRLKYQGGVYKDVEVTKIGRLDVYTVPLRSGSTIIGFMQLARVNYIWPVLTQSLLLALLIQLPITWMASVYVIRWGTRATLSPLAELVEKVEELQVDNLPETFSIHEKMDYDVRLLTKTLQTLIARARTSMMRQREIAQNLSHEFKTPLARVNARLSLMRPKVSKDQVKILDAITVEIVGLGEQVDSLLDVAIHEVTAYQSSVTNWKLKALCEELIQAISNPQRVVLDIPDRFVLPIPIGHARTVLRNILENAVKYGLPEGQIKIQLHQFSHQWRLTISNATSASIRGENTKNIFLRHYRGFLASSIQGHGLGMAIVRDICRQLGLEVHFISSDPDNVRVELCGKMDKSG